MTAIDATPRGVEMVAIRVGETMERWGRERAARRATEADPRKAMRARIEADAARAAQDAVLMRIL